LAKPAKLGSSEREAEIRNMVPTEYIIPMLVCRNASSEIEFCKAAFGAVEVSRRAAQDGAVVHAALRIGTAMIMVHGEVPMLASRAPQVDGSSAVVIYIYLQDVDVVVDRAIRAGARLLLPVTNASWGDRVGRIVDQEGHVWNIATHIQEKGA
jgi:PhnB protein